MTRKLSKFQWTVLALPVALMLAVAIGGGIGTYSNMKKTYGSETAVGVLAAGEGATAVLALLMVGLTMLGQSSPLVIRIGLWALPGIAAVMGATAANGDPGKTIVFAATPMAITAGSEGLAFLARRIVVHTEGRDIEAEARNASAVRDLAYHQARAAAHPSKGVKKRSVRKSWRIAKHVGAGDTALGIQLVDIQRQRMTAGADAALSRMFNPDVPVPGLTALPASADTVPALPAASADDAVTSRRHESTIPADTSGYPNDTADDQGENTKTARRPLRSIPGGEEKKPSMRADVLQMFRDGVQDLRHVVDAVATRHDRDADDPKFRQTVGRYWREANADASGSDDQADVPTGQYL